MSFGFSLASLRCRLFEAPGRAPRLLRAHFVLAPFAATLVLLPWTANAQEEEPRVLEARALFQAGQVAYDDGRFEDAQEHFQRSYELSGRAELLYNIGLAADRARNDKEALEAYEAFIERLPDSPHARRARNRIRALRQLVEAEGGEESEASSSAAAPEREDSSVLPLEGSAPFLVLGGGAAALIAGGVLVGLAVADVETVEYAAPGTRWSEVADAYDRSEPLSIVGFLLLGAGTAMSAAGLAWALLEPDGEGAPRAELQIGPGSLSVRGTF